MNDRSTLALVFVAVVLACATIFFERDVSTTPYQAADRYNIFRGLKADNLDRIVLVAEKGSVILKRGGSRWLFERPLGDAYTVEWEADADAVNRLVSLLVNLREAGPAKVSTATAPLDMVAEGLQNPRERVEVVYGSQRGPISATLSLGRADTLENGRSVRLARVNSEDRVLTIDNTLDQMLNLVREGGSDFRSRKVFPRDDLSSSDTITIIRPDYQAQLDRVSKQIWQAQWLTSAADKPKVVRCSAAPSAKLAKAMQELRVIRFIQDTSSEQDFAKYGLLRPQAAVKLALGSEKEGILAMLSGQQAAELRIGGAVDGSPNELYAMAQRQPVIFTIDKAFLDVFPKDPQKELPDPRLVGIASDDVTAITVKNLAGTLRAKRKNYDWSVTSPIEMDGDGQTIMKLIDAITRSKSDDVVWRDGKDSSAFGLRNPVATVSLSFMETREGKEQKRTERLHFGKTFEKEVEVTKKVDDPDKKGEKKDVTTKEMKKFIYARRTSDVAIRIFPLEKMKAALEAPTAFLERRALEFDNFKARKFTYTRPDGTWTFEKRTNDWFCTSPTTLKADQGHLGGLVSAMTWLTGDKIVSLNTSDLATYGLDKPTHRLVVELEPEPEEADADKKDETKEDAKKDGEKTEEKQDEPKKMKPPAIHTLLIAKKVDGDTTTYFGHVVGKPLIFTLANDFTERLDKELINTDVLPRAWTLKEATATFAGGSLRLTRDVSGQVFKVAAGADAPLEDADKEKGRQFFDKLGNIRVEGRYLAYDAKDMTPYGFEKPFATISTKSKDESERTAEFGAVADESKHGKGMRYGRIVGQTAVFIVKQETLDAVLKPAANYKPSTATKPEGSGEMGPPEKRD